ARRRRWRPAVRGGTSGVEEAAVIAAAVAAGVGVGGVEKIVKLFMG
ncbi:Os12g0117700, partial [Oryza sativa Japonica Group]